MARKIADLSEVQSRSNLTTFDRKKMKADVEGLMALREDVASANQAVGERYKALEKDRGYNLKALKMGVALAKQSPEAARDFMRTFLPLVDAMGLIPQKDLVDLAQEAS